MGAFGVCRGGGGGGGGGGGWSGCLLISIILPLE